jgi:tryptophan 2,3-dioxygenase
MSFTYSDYLEIDRLLSLQRPRSSGPAHDELLFITIHQAYELWFQEMLHELDYVQRLFSENDVPRALETMKRLLAIQRLLVQQLEPLKTMSPLGFLSFRDDLGTASGFQSFQFRELEFALGQRNKAALERFPEGSAARARLEARLSRPSLWDSFLRYLARNGHPVPEGALVRKEASPSEPSPEVRAVLLKIYATNPLLAYLCERLADLDEAFQDWRYQHMKMVERVIGHRRGTGGSAGVTYLRKTLFRPLFPELWAIRTEFET